MVTSVDNITKNLSTKISITVDGDSLDDDELSSRGRELEQAGGLADKFKKIFGNLYDPVHNPNGIVNIGVAENVPISLPFHCVVFPLYHSNVEEASHAKL